MGCGCGNRASPRRNTLVPRTISNGRQMAQLSAIRRQNVLSTAQPHVLSLSQPSDAKRGELERMRREQILRRFGKL